MAKPVRLVQMQAVHRFRCAAGNKFFLSGTAAYAFKDRKILRRDLDRALYDADQARVNLCEIFLRARSKYESHFQPP